MKYPLKMQDLDKNNVEVIALQNPHNAEGYYFTGIKLRLKKILHQAVGLVKNFLILISS